MVWHTQIPQSDTFCQVSNRLTTHKRYIYIKAVWELCDLTLPPPSVSNRQGSNYILISIISDILNALLICSWAPASVRGCPTSNPIITWHQPGTMSSNGWTSLRLATRSSSGCEATLALDGRLTTDRAAMPGVGGRVPTPSSDLRRWPLLFLCYSFGVNIALHLAELCASLWLHRPPWLSERSEQNPMTLQHSLYFGANLLRQWPIRTWHVNHERPFMTS